MAHRLPVLQSSLDRRQALIVGVAAAATACGPNPNFGLIDEALPRSADAGEDDDAGEPADLGESPVDVGTAPLDVGTVPRDVGTAPRDVGTAPRDVGTPPRDSGTPDAGVTPRDSGPPDTGPSCTPSGTMVGTVASLAVGAYRVMGTGRSTVIVGRDAAGFFAFLGVCPHQSCALGAPVGGSIVCRCHGARFDANGAVTQGPARTSLPHRQITVCAGVVYLGTATVDAATRTPA